MTLLALRFKARADRTRPVTNSAIPAVAWPSKSKVFSHGARLDPHWNTGEPFRYRQLNDGCFLSVALANHLSHGFLESESECRQFFPGRIGSWTLFEKLMVSTV